MNFKCTRCGHKTKLKGDMKKHIKRKKLCKPLLSDIIPLEDESTILKPLDSLFCKYCNKKISRGDNLKRHMEKCSKKSDKNLDVMEELVKALNNQNQTLKKQVDNLQELIKKAGLGTTNVYNNTMNTVNFNILPYNETDVSHLTDKFFYKTIDRCLSSVPRLIDHVHFNPKKPENHNIYISNISKGHAMIWDGKKWLIKDKQDVVENLIMENEYRLEDWIQEGSKKYPKAMEKFKLWSSKRTAKGVPEMVHKDVTMLLYNNRDMVEKTKKLVES
jgi:hypothetical protein